ncbi:MAG: hypothetical protein AAGJ37_03785 [Pseudomonadota bacterium]
MLDISQISLTRMIAFATVIALLSGCGSDILVEENQEPDPVVVDVPIAYIARDIEISEGEPVRDITDPTEFIPGATLFIQARANASAEPVNISQRLFPDALDEEGIPLPFDIKDLKADYTGTRIVFSVRAPELDGMDEEPTWNIWEYDSASDTLQRVIDSDIVAEAGHDTGPVYLADGRIVFSSTRQRGNQARLLDEGKPQYSGLEEGLDASASVLHVMNADGSNVQQISFNQSHDLDPLILPNGKLLFSRWDQMSGNKGLNLYQMNADGSDLELMYGRHSHNVIPDIGDIQYAKASVTPEGQVLMGLYSFSNNRFGTDFVTIDIDSFVDFETPLASLTSLQGPAQQSALIEGIVLDGNPSTAGLINALYPLWDGSGRVLYSWSQCRLFEPLPEGSPEDATRTIAPCSAENIASETFELAPPAYGLWMYDPVEDTQISLRLPQTEIVVSEVLAMEQKSFPVDPDSTIDRTETTLIDEGYGVLHIQSVYDVDGEDTSPFGLTQTANPSLTTPDQRPARFLRIIKSVSIPDEDTFEFDNSAFGRSRNQLMREILGYTPIQPDGSVEVAIPANVPFSIAIVDANGMSISPRHDNWLQLMPGEKKNCIGCHTRNSEQPHGRIDAQPASINLGAPSTGVAFPGASPALFADLGETMAQTFTRVNGLPKLTADIVFDDLWTDENATTPAASFTYAYGDLSSQIPISQACAQVWTSLCRAVINYVEHIQPVFLANRQILDADENIVSDSTCITCHSPTDADGLAQVPAGQLELIETPSLDRPEYVTSYRELLFNDNVQEAVDGVLLDTVELVFDGNGAPVFLTDENGELILDAEDNPIQATRLIGVPASMSTNGARNSGRFFAVFSPGGSHDGFLNSAELRLISEWLDIGAQYYNNPFDAPEDD